MTDKFPRRRIEPLAPPPDAFERVLRTARARRRRNALVLASSTLTLVLVVAGSFALSNMADQDGPDGLNAAAHETTSPPTTPSASAEPHQRKHRKSPTSTPHVGAIGGSNVVTSYLKGRVVDAEGTGVSGLYVLPGVSDHTTYVPSGGYWQTDADGRYTIPCPHAPVLLASWPVNTTVSASAAADAHWAATFVEGSAGAPVTPSCGHTEHTTVVSPGSAVTVHVQVADPDNCEKGQTFGLWVWLNGSHDARVQLLGLHDKDQVIVGGLPPGSHTLEVQGRGTSVSVTAGGDNQATGSFYCGEQPPDDQSTSPTDSSSPPVTPSPDPTTPTPTPTPTP